MRYLGLDLGGTKLAGAAFDRSGQMLARSVDALNGRRGGDVGGLIIDLIRQLLQGEPASASCIGISVPGIVYHDSGKVWAPNIPGWDDYPLRPQLAEALALPTERISIDSDRACYILGESWQGAAKGCKHAIYMAVGTGIGAGILIDGTILRGAHDIAGATGWLALSKPFRDEYNECGCFEYHASGTGLARVVRDCLAGDEAYDGRLSSIPPQQLTAEDVFAAYSDSDAIAVAVIDQAIEYWGMAAANYVSLFNPEKIIFGGGVFGPASQLIARIYTEARRWAQPISITQVSFEASTLGSDAGLIGAGNLALRAGSEGK